MSAQRPVRGCPTGSLTFPGRDSRSEPGHPGGAQAARTSRRQARPRSPRGLRLGAGATRGGPDDQRRSRPCPRSSPAPQPPGSPQKQGRLLPHSQAEAACLAELENQSIKRALRGFE